MKKICFVCLGNICRSPMAEFIMKEYLRKEHLENEFVITSRATSKGELGNDMHDGAKRELSKQNIPYVPHISTPLKKEDYQDFDYFIGMDQSNVEAMKRLFGKTEKLYRMMDFANIPKDIRDPWYTGDFHETYEDLKVGCHFLLDDLKKD